MCPSRTSEGPAPTGRAGGFPAREEQPGSGASTQSGRSARRTPVRNSTESRGRCARKDRGRSQRTLGVLGRFKRRGPVEKRRPGGAIGVFPTHDHGGAPRDRLPASRPRFPPLTWCRVRESAPRAAPHLVRSCRRPLQAGERRPPKRLRVRSAFFFCSRVGLARDLGDKDALGRSQDPAPGAVQPGECGREPGGEGSAGPGDVDGKATRRGQA